MCLRNPVRCSACGRWSCPSSPPCAPPAAGEWRCTWTRSTCASSASRSWLAGGSSRAGSSVTRTSPRSAPPRPPSASWATRYRLLGHRARSREELRRRLLAKEHDEHAVDDALERLAADGFLDDAAFARSYVADKRRLDSWGAERIRRGLRELGVDSCADRRRPRRGRRGRGGRTRPRPRPASPPRRSGAAARRGPQARLPDASAQGVLVCPPPTPPSASGWTRRRRGRIDSARRRHVLSKHATCARALCIPLSLLHGDTDGAQAPNELNRSTRGQR